MMEQVRWGVLGNAMIARDYFIPAIRAAENCTLFAVASRNPAGCSFGENVRLYDSYDALLHDPDVQAVYVPLPNALHCEWVIRALECGKHVLCEKPMAMNAEECRRMISAAKDNGRILAEAYMYRYSRKTQLIRSLVASGKIGNLRSVRAHFGYKKDFDSPGRDQKALGGGCLYDVGCYCVDAINYFMRLQGAYCVDGHAHFYMDGEVDTHVSASLRYSNGTVHSLDAWFDSCSHQSIMLIGDQGILDAEWGFRGFSHEIRLITEEGSQSIQTPASESYTLEAEAFADAVLRGSADQLMPLEDSLRNAEVMDLLLRDRQ